ncbi:hypothetical protein Cylst_3466 [Cylindrospermum stagnale PCC 7417]|uniref:Uncharacterized protein n=1 Tax=Cylindrospermum stagnale PCC 7417 TaxID=56107 RepID=K9WZJ2_9NOST|nr:hypothetical protein [Cylindrospermum stagnale]AFZ25613.1 hypothetical protein Cylst_3466 [Cylindrospermum stagnale PCC 7417]
MSSKKRFKNPPKESGNKLFTPSDKEEIPPEQQPPIFSLRYLEGEYCLTKCDKDDQAAFALKIHRLSKLTWSQIQSQDRHKLGYEKIARDAIKSPIPKFITEDVNIIAFRFSGMKPMVGYRDRAIFYVIWLDRDFTLYDHS